MHIYVPQILESIMWHSWDLNPKSSDYKYHFYTEIGHILENMGNVM